MSTVRLENEIVRVELTRWERLAGLLCDAVVPVGSVVGVAVLEDPVDALRGVRGPGLGVPGRRKVGTWRHHGDREFVCVRRGEPAVRLTVSGGRYRTYTVGTADAPAVAAQISARVGVR